MAAGETQPASSVFCLEEDIRSPCPTEILQHLSAESLLRKRQSAVAVLLTCSSHPSSVPSEKSMLWERWDTQREGSVPQTTRASLCFHESLQGTGKHCRAGIRANGSWVGFVSCRKSRRQSSKFKMIQDSRSSKSMTYSGKTGCCGEVTHF